MAFFLFLEFYYDVPMRSDIEIYHLTRKIHISQISFYYLATSTLNLNNKKLLSELSPEK
jgi:hypothetical protein